MMKRLSQRFFNEIYSKVPRLCIDLVIKDKRGIVLTKRDINPYKGMWHIPGGTLLLGENIEQCAKRVAKYETGLKIKIRKLLGVEEYHFFAKYTKVVSLVYLVEPTEGKLLGSKDGLNVKFFKKIPSKSIKFQKNFLYKYLKVR